MSNYRPIDSKREEFRKYLERAGVMDALTKVLVSLYEEAEKPDNALDYVRSHLGGAEGEDIDTLKADLEASNAKVQSLEEDNARLKEKLAQYEPPEEGSIAPTDGDQPPPEGDAGLTPPEEQAEGDAGSVAPSAAGSVAAGSTAPPEGAPEQPPN